MIIISKKVLSGQSSEDFPAIQEKNLALLMKTLEKKEATEALTAMGKTDRETWTNIAMTVVELKEIISIGGASELLQSFKDSVKESLDLAIEGALSPITNTLNTIVGEILAPAFVWLNDISNDLSQFIAGNKTGAFFGAMIGSIFGPMTQLIGGLLGAAVEELIQSLGDLPEIFGVGRQSKEEWMAQHLFQLYFGGQITKEEYYERMAALEIYFPPDTEEEMD